MVLVSLFLFGAIFGSFYNVCIYRLPKDLNLVTKKSFCTSCKYLIPFYLNILAYFFKDQALWLVQLSPALTVFTSVFVVYYMDPRFARFIDSKEINKTPDVVFEMIVMRVIGRVLILAIAILMYFQYAHISA